MNAITMIEPTAANGLALELPEGQSFDDWKALGEKLCSTERVLNWWIGDWWAAGEHRYGERAKAAAEGLFKLSFGALRNAATVCRSFEASRRRDVLSWSHHVEVAALPPDEADAILDRAQDRGWSKQEVRSAATERKRALGLIREREPEPYADEPIIIETKAITNAWDRASDEAKLLAIIHINKTLPEDRRIAA